MLDMVQWAASGQSIGATDVWLCMDMNLHLRGAGCDPNLAVACTLTDSDVGYRAGHPSNTSGQSLHSYPQHSCIPLAQRKTQPAQGIPDKHIPPMRMYLQLY